MMIAYNIQSSNLFKHPSMPGEYFFEKYEIAEERQSEFKDLGYIVKTQADFESIMAAIDLSAYTTAIEPTLDSIVNNSIVSAIAFGSSLMLKFKRENVYLGISATDKIPYVTRFAHYLAHFLEDGSAKEAIKEIDRLILLDDLSTTSAPVPTSENPTAANSYTKAELGPFITNARLTVFKNLIQDYFGIPHT